LNATHSAALCTYVCTCWQVGKFKGYNEIVVASDPWIAHLPHSVQAIFMVACQEGDRNTNYHGSGSADKMGTAPSCGAARERARDTHAAYLAIYGIARDAFPLLELRPHDWERPFALAAT
jgi:hypothetical protein